MSHEPPDERLREVFVSLAQIAGDGSLCPQPARLWASAHEELPGGENQEVVLHTAECAACATAWRLARELSLSERSQVPAPHPNGPRLARSLLRWTPLLAAAALVAGVAGLWLARLPHGPVAEPVYRSPEGRWLETRVPAGAALSREAFVLRWVAGPLGTTYDLQLTSEELEPLALASGLRQAEHQVEERALSAIPAGKRVLWRVVAHLPDGRVVASRTFVTVVQ